MQKQLKFLLKIYNVVELIFGIRKVANYDGKSFSETSIAYKTFSISASLLKFLIFCWGIEIMANEWKFFVSEAHLILTIASYTSLSLAHIIVVLHGIFNGWKYRKNVFISIINFDTCMNFTNFDRFKTRILCFHLFYFIFKSMHLIFVILVSYDHTIFAQVLYHYSMMALELEILHYVIEINEIAIRVDYLNTLLSSFLNFDIKYDSFLIKLWKCKNIEREMSCSDFKKMTNLYIDLYVVLSSVVSCYGPAVITLYFLF